MTYPILVLTSGGLDSACCIAYYRDQGLPVRAFWVDYGQPAARPEYLAAEHLATHYGVPLQTLRVQGVQWPGLAGNLFEYRGRNLTLAALALNTTPVEGGLVALGIHQGTDFADCSAQFAEQLDQVLPLLSDGRVRLDCPFLTWTKEQIVHYACLKNVPLELTYSCEPGAVPPCREYVKRQDQKMCCDAIANYSASNGDEQ